MIIETEFANFGNPQDLYRYMVEEHINVANVTVKYWGAVLPSLEMTLQDVKNWSEHKDLHGNLID